MNNSFSASGATACAPLFHDYANQSSRILGEPLPLTRTVRGADLIEGIQVIDTPGYTRGAVSYLIESAGKRIACTGDLIHGDGRLWDLFSLQDSIPEVKEDGCVAKKGAHSLVGC